MNDLWMDGSGTRRAEYKITLNLLLRQCKSYSVSGFK